MTHDAPPTAAASTPRLYPAVDVVWHEPAGDDGAERLLASLDDFAPAAIEDLPNGVRAFFTTAADRDNALGAVAAAVGVTLPAADVTALVVSDDSWAERSQAALGPVRIGRIIVSPPWSAASTDVDAARDLLITILPSMGFGTGHHASTRLCLGLLQSVALTSAAVLDVGTGSGVLAIAASRLGASNVVAIDVDEDALTSARENLDLNGLTEAVRVRSLDLTDGGKDLAERFDVLTANLTGAMLMRYAAVLAAWLQPDGQLIVSGFQTHEAADVSRTFGAIGLEVAGRGDEDDWVALRLAAPSATS